MFVSKRTLATIASRPASVFSDGLVDSVNATMSLYDITTPIRQAHFLAQVLHESGGFRFVSEIWGPTEAQRGYEGRLDLGNTEDGDGFRYRGRGYIQLTGRANYTKYSEYVGLDFVSDPDRLLSLPWAVDVAGWFWKLRGLNALADEDRIRDITKRINGGTNGLADRVKYYTVARELIHPHKIDPRKATMIPVVSPPSADTLRESAPPERAILPSKPFWASKRIWGAVITTLGFFGGEVEWAKALLVHYDEIITIIGIVLNIYGSAVAKEKLTLWK